MFYFRNIPNSHPIKLSDIGDSVNIDLIYPGAVLRAYMLSLPHSAGDSRNYIKSPASLAEDPSPAISTKPKF